MINEISAKDLPELPGTPMCGGFFVGCYIDQHDGCKYALIDSGKAGEFEGSWGKESGWTADLEATSYTDGLANTTAMAEAGSEIALEVRALTLNGFDDWCIPARDQQELQYRLLKPTTQENTCSFKDGDNPSSVPPGYRYTPESPAQTVAEDYRDNSEQAFRQRWYWSSTQDSDCFAGIQSFADGYQCYDPKCTSFAVRAVRRVKVIS